MNYLVFKIGVSLCKALAALAYTRKDLTITKPRLTMTSSGPMINKSEHCNYDNPIPLCHPYSHVLTFERCKGKSRDYFACIC